MKKELVIITGISGAGKNTALDVFEDFGYFCIDNMPALLVDSFLNLLREKDIGKAAVIIDIRSKNFNLELNSLVQEILKDEDFNVKILYIDCCDEVLVNRYKETRKNHPLSATTSLLEGIKSEREIIAPFKVFANYVYDTSDWKTKDFIEKLSEDFSIKKEDRYHVTISSFGYKYGMPIDADNVIDVRFLNNPFYIEGLRHKTGLDEEVYNFVMTEDLTKDFYEKLKELMLFLVDKYKYEGRDKVAIAIGCTGGRHRSVSIARTLFADIEAAGYKTYINHRDINKVK